MYKLLKCLIYCGIIFVCAGRPGLPPTRERRGLLKIYRKGRGEGAKGAEGMTFVDITPDVIRAPEQRVQLVCSILDTRLRG